MIEAAIPLSKLENLSRTGHAHLRPIYAAMRSGGVGLILVRQRIGQFPPPKKRPFVAIVGDDTDRSLGPADFHRKSIRRLAAITHGVVVMSCELVPSVYATTAAVARLGVSTLIVETRPEHEGEWLDFVKEAAPTANLLICTVAAGTA